jgi:hypothetical protein
VRLESQGDTEKKIIRNNTEQSVILSPVSKENITSVGP